MNDMLCSKQTQHPILPRQISSSIRCNNNPSDVKSSEAGMGTTLGHCKRSLRCQEINQQELKQNVITRYLISKEEDLEDTAPTPTTLDEEVVM